MTELFAGWLPDSHSAVRVHPAHDGFAYSDGDEVENRILHILIDCADLSVGSEALREQVSDWPTEYHFSPHRGNLLAHLPIGQGVRVLELGAGCGAISRAIGETGAALTSIEGSLSRARCAAARCRDLPNVQIGCARFDQLSAVPVYDYVLLIGVLEYAACYSDASNPHTELLQRAASFLKPSGTLVVAIENQLGLKYFCGAPEDHLGQVSAGLEDRYTTKSVRTFGRVELTTLLRSSGLPSIEFQLPFPDYKLPQLVLTEQGVRDPGFSHGELIRHVVSNVRTRTLQPRHTDEGLAWPVVVRNELVSDLANSFLVLARRNESAANNSEKILLSSSYTTHRRKNFATTTRFWRHNAAIFVEKNRLWPALPASVGDIELLATQSAYILAPTLERQLLAAVAQTDYSTLLALLTRWVDFLSLTGTAAESGSTRLRRPIKPEYVDCNPWNLLVVNGAFVPFDLEWRYQRPCRAEVVVMRYLFCMRYLFGALDVPGERAVVRLARDLGIETNAELWQALFSLETAFVAVSGERAPHLAEGPALIEKFFATREDGLEPVPVASIRHRVARAAARTLIPAGLRRRFIGILEP